jgi:4-aminobutyrate aminotransferase-like enzyme
MLYPRTEPVHHRDEPLSNAARELVARYEPCSLRTYTPTQAVLARSAGIFHWTPEGRRLYDFTSGVLVANLGHNPADWLERFLNYLGWSPAQWQRDRDKGTAYSPALPLTAYNAVTEVEAVASQRLGALLQGRPGGRRLEQVMWAASGSEAIQKALWAALARDRSRDVIVATRYGFHGKKGLAGAVSGCEDDPDRDSRVRFVSFPMDECADISQRNRAFDPGPYLQELQGIQQEFGGRLGVLITEPYLGAAGSYHPPPQYLQLLQNFCRRNDIVFILDEIQSNFGRTRELFAFETYGLEPDMVVLGKGLGNGVPVAAAVGRADLFASLDYGEASDTWSANPLSSAAVLATLDEFAARDILGASKQASGIIEEGLVRLKQFPFVAHVRGERGGMVWGLETRDHAGRTAAEWANAVVLACYLGEPGSTEGDGIHLLGPLAKKVLRIAPPLIISEREATEAMLLVHRILTAMASK